MEVFNEATIALCCYHLFGLSDFTDSYETKENVGNSFIAVVLFNMFLNIYICSKDQVLRLIKKCCKKVK